ncbi:MAG: InlB B-repeat-containing protein [Bacilli bacterium]|nr:InlB B-repeat-containing protein [Bacilli bacterium]
MKKKILLVSLLTAGMLFSCSEKTPDGDKSVADNSATTSQSAPKASSSTAPKYKVTFDLNYTGAAKGTVKTAGNDGKVTLPEDPEKEDSVFLGWNTKADGTGTAVTKDDVYTADTTVYAKWHHHAYGAEVVRAGSKTAEPYETPSKNASATCHELDSCGMTKISWSALDIIESESAQWQLQENNTAIRFNGQVHKNQSETDEGSHLVYEIYSPKAIAKANLYITAIWHSNGVAYWSMIENDDGKGYEKNEAGEWYRPDYRWGLAVNGVKCTLSETEHKTAPAGEVDEEMMPTEFALNEGINKIDVYNYGGYRAKMTAMKIMGK